MSSRTWKWLAGTVLALGVPAALTAWSLLPTTEVEAADHNDPSSRITAMDGPMDRKADIADVYLWHQGEKIIAVVGFGGPLPAAMTGGATPVGNYDRDVAFQLLIDNNDDRTPDHTIDVRFGQDSMGAWGVQFTGVPGEATPVSGAVQTNLDAPGGSRLYAGVNDDPFFFDLEGFNETLMTGTLSFDNTQDFFARKNTTFIVLELDKADVLVGADTTLQVWATSSRFPGGGT